MYVFIILYITGGLQVDRDRLVDRRMSVG